MLFNGDLKMVPVSYTLSGRGATSGKSRVSAPRYITDKGMYGGKVAYIPVYIPTKFGLN